ncbi:3-ketoacyl-CoA thiolase, mitochondrial [Folsomia candida]|uniref:3-ketoacyl-CoA thiolase, mitochondrial n=1 Tax=Folsomia candida TaxID=158441 RepID=A0A226D955_FOLCA|nr:3-ketoacyl-CoA thiolase, mitochondrial [Folsomia candida]
MASITKGIFIVAAKRTPFGAFGGKLSSKTSIDLAEVASKAALAAGNVNPEIIDSVVVGNVISSSSEDGPFISRHLLLRCGIPLDRPALNVNRMCGSGFQAIVTGAHDITMGDSKVVLTAGSESMSGAPFHLRNIRFGTKLGADYKVEDHLWSSGFDSYCKTNMGGTAENLAEKYGISRQEADEFSFRSQQRWKAANDQGFFAKEMAPVTVKGKGGVETSITTDEHPRPNTTLEMMSKLPAKELDIDPAKLNVNGGAVAIGHPVGASGSRITAHLVQELKRRGVKHGIGSACIGGGQGIALLLESL